jgi:hypothetical protein
MIAATVMMIASPMRRQSRSLLLKIVVKMILKAKKVPVIAYSEPAKN